ncbi:MAG: EAL and HDOD domain-containing protein, partial [Pseudomonadota bacterium]
VARQPIYNRRLELVGYELLYRDNKLPRACFEDGAKASSQLIINTFMGFGLESIVGSNPAFINLTRDFFIDERPIPMSCEQVVLEIAEKRLPEPHVLHGLQQLAADGYVIALDDFVFKPELEPLLELAQIVKIDHRSLGREGVAKQAQLCRPYGVKLLAERLERPEEMEYCRELGFDYFQGYFFCKPQLVQARSQPANRAVTLQLLEKLQDEQADMEQLEQIIIQDVTLTYKLLRYLNCATYALRREINSVREALMLIGTRQVRQWALLLMMSSYDEGKPRELIATALVRAHMCEQLARLQPECCDPQQAFTVGLFSTLDAVMDTPMEELLDTTTLSAPIKLALLAYEGALGQLLKQVLRYERGDWEPLANEGEGRRDYTDAYLQAVQWSDGRLRELAAGG